MPEQGQELEPAPAEPLFELDLGANGGHLAPTTLEEFRSWITREIQFWQPFREANVGGHTYTIAHAIQGIHAVLGKINEAANYGTLKTRTFEI